MDRKATSESLNKFDSNKVITSPGHALPRWRQGGTTYFITWNLCDALPQIKQTEIRRERARWLFSKALCEQLTPLLADPRDESTLNLAAAVSLLSAEDKVEYWQTFDAQENEILDQGYGECVLKDPRYRNIVADALLYFHGDRYELYDFVIMPNHVHLLVRPCSPATLSKILHSWKSFTAKEINRIRERSGQFWHADSYNRIIRSPKHFLSCQRYITNNPARARLETGSFMLRTTPLVDLETLHNSQ